MLLVIAVSIVIVSKYFVRWYEKPQVEQKLSDETSFESAFIADMESIESYIIGASSFSNQYALSGTHSSLMPEKGSYSAGILLDIQTTDTSLLSEATIDCWLLPTTENIHTIIILSIIDSTQTKTIHWDGHGVKGENYTPKTWSHFSHKFKIPSEFLIKGNKIKVYLWNYNEDNSAIYADDLSLTFNNSKKKQKERTLLINFENIEDPTISNQYAKSGSYSSKTSGKDSYSYSIIKEFSDFDMEHFDELNYRFWFYAEDSEVDYVLVFSFLNPEGDVIYWFGDQVSSEQAQSGKWTKKLGVIVVPSEVLKPENKVQIYGWNRNDNTVFIDDIYIVLKSNEDLKNGEKAFCDLANNQDFTQRTNYPPYPFKKFIYQDIKTQAINEIPNKNWSHQYFTIGDFTNDEFDEIIYCPPEKPIIIYYTIDNEIKSCTSNKLSNEMISCALHSEREKDLFVFFDNSTKTISINQILIQDNKMDIKEIKSIAFNSVGIKSSITQATSIYNPQNKQSGLIVSSKEELLLITLQDTSFLNQIVIEKYDEHINAKILSDDFIDISGEELFTIVETPINTQFKTYSFDLQFNPKIVNKNTHTKQGFDSLKISDTYISGIFDNSSYATLIKIDHTWRFDMKLLKLNAMGYNISSQAEYIGNENKNDPRFYPKSFVLSANIIGNKKNELIIFSSNKPNYAIVSNKLNNLPSKTSVYAVE